MHRRIRPGDDLQAAIASHTVIELAPGRYHQDLLLDGIEDLSLRPQPGAEEEICFWRTGLRIVDCSDIWCEGLTFRQAPHSAVVIERSRTVSIEACSFLACGTVGGGVTCWLGKETALCGIERCHFDTCGLRAPRHDKPSHVHDIAIMCHEVDCTGHRFVGNRIQSYGYGLQLGTSGTCRHEGRHRVEGNVIDHPSSDGIHVKQARCLVRDNLVRGASRYAISARAGSASRFEVNHLQDCQHGIRILGADHEVVGNRLERCRRYGVWLAAARDNGDGFAAANTLVEGNIFTDCGDCDPHPLVAPPGAVICCASPEAQRISENRHSGSARVLASPEDIIAEP